MLMHSSCLLASRSTVPCWIWHRGWWPSPARGGWNTEQLVLNRSYLVPGSTTPVSPQFLDIGTLVLGSWWD